MKVFHIVPTIHEEAAGPSYSVPRLCEFLRKEGIDIELDILEAKQKPLLDFIKTFRPSKIFKKLGFSGAMFSWLKNIASNGQTSIFHIHSLWMMPNIYPGWAARGSSVKLIISPRGTLSPFALNINKWLKKIFWICLQGPVVRQASCLHATAKSEYFDIRALGFSQPVCIIPNGIDVPEYKKSTNNLNKRTLLYLGRLHPKKGLSNLLKAWGQVESHFPNWNLKIVGPSELNQLSELINLANEMSLERVEFFDSLYGEEKLNAYRQADLFILPTYSENFGMTVAESLAAGTPVIVTKGAPWPEIEDRNAGWWIDIGVGL